MSVRYFEMKIIAYFFHFLPGNEAIFNGNFSYRHYRDNKTPIYKDICSVSIVDLQSILREKQRISFYVIVSNMTKDYVKHKQWLFSIRLLLLLFSTFVSFF